MGELKVNLPKGVRCRKVNKCRIMIEQIPFHAMYTIFV